MLKDKRTTAPHGITPEEVRRLSGGLYLLDKYCRSKRNIKIYWAVIGDAVLEQPSEESYSAFSRVKSRLVRLQERNGLPRYWCETLEVTNGLHSNLIFPATASIAESLNSAFPDYFQGEKSIQLVENRKGLEAYLVKESTPQASHLSPYRQKGSHRYNGIGDRVSMSQELKQKAVSSGTVSDWKRTNAKRSPEPRTYAKRMKPSGYMRLSGQIELFPDIAQQATRLKDYHGGILSPSAALELEYRRKQAGLSQKRLGMISGVSQPQIANAIHCRFGLSRQAAKRLKEVLAA